VSIVNYFSKIIVVSVLLTAEVGASPTQAEISSFKNYIGDIAGTGEIGGGGYSTRYRLNTISKNGCDVVIEEINSIKVRAVNEKMIERFTFNLKSLKKDFQYMNSMGQFLVVFSAVDGENLGYQAVSGNIPDGSGKYKSSSIGFRFDDDRDARGYARLVSKMVKKCRI